MGVKPGGRAVSTKALKSLRVDACAVLAAHLPNGIPVPLARECVKSVCEGYYRSLAADGGLSGCVRRPSVAASFILCAFQLLQRPAIRVWLLLLSST
jgi:hypothetical protein